MNVPDDLRYTADHEWVRLDADLATVGITSFAASALGDVVYVAAPAVGETLTAGEVCGEIESTKAVSELYAPATGEVTEVNDAAVSDPALLNHDPFGAGWLLRMRVRELPGLLDASAYSALLHPDAR